MKNNQGSCNHLHTHIEGKIRKKVESETLQLEKIEILCSNGQIDFFDDFSWNDPLKHGGIIIKGLMKVASFNKV